VLSQYAFGTPDLTLLADGTLLLVRDQRRHPRSRRPYDRGVTTPVG
jgi:hypothetical protein